MRTTSRSYLYRVRTKDRAARASSSTVRGYKRWIDPFPNVHGTKPEKMVYAELTRRNIPFLFLNDINFTIPEIGLTKEYQADFVMPSLKLIIEVQGAYFHSMEKSIISDAFKFAIYESAGYKILPWWDYDIESRLLDLFSSEPLLHGATTSSANNSSSELPVLSRKKQDTSKGIRTLNRRRALRNAYRKKAVNIRTKRTKFS